MKTIMMTLAVVGITFCSANAQNRNEIPGGDGQGATTAPITTATPDAALPKETVKIVKKTEKYKVCEDKGGYYTCCDHKRVVSVKVKQPAKKVAVVAKQPVVVAAAPKRTAMPVAKVATVRKHTVKRTNTVAMTKTTGAKTASNTGGMCRVLPYNVYKIMPDRKTVKSYQTMDADKLTPLNDEVTYYGANGEKPEQVAKHPVNAIVVQGAPKKEYVKKDEKNKTTTIVTTAKPMVRQADGTYSYK